MKIEIPVQRLHRVVFKALFCRHRARYVAERGELLLVLVLVRVFCRDDGLLSRRRRRLYDILFGIIIVAAGDERL